MCVVNDKGCHVSDCQIRINAPDVLRSPLFVKGIIFVNIHL